MKPLACNDCKREATEAEWRYLVGRYDAIGGCDIDWRCGCAGVSGLWLTFPPGPDSRTITVLEYPGKASA